MIRSLLRRVAGAAALATVAGLVAAPAFQAQAATPATTSLSIRVVDPTIELGDSARITGHLAIRGDVSAAGRTVTLEARPRGTDEFVPVAETVTGEKGGVRLTVTPEVSTRYRWRFAGAEDAAASLSGVAGVRVVEDARAPRRLATSLSIRHVQRVTETDTIDIVRGKLRARRVALHHRPVILLSRTADDTSWTFEGMNRTRRHGVVRFVVDPAQDTAYRLVFLGTRLLMPARSGVVRIAVPAPTA